MRLLLPALAVVAAVVVAPACAGRTGGGGDPADSSAAPDVAASACNAWPGPDASVGGCMTGRSLTVCTYAGGFSICLGPCDGGACHDDCQANEYAVSCYAGPPSPGGQDPMPPPSCRLVESPSLDNYFCCPCE